MYKILEEKDLIVGKAEQNTLIHGDCLNVMPYIADGSIDAIITDLPYGTTACKWDTIIPFEPMWKEVKRVLKPNGAFITTVSQPFTSALIMSNPKWFKHSWVWDKNRGNGHLVAKVRPLQRTEDIPVFCKGSPTYNPIMIPRDKPRKFGKTPSTTSLLSKQKYQENFKRQDYTERYPTNIISVSWSIRNGLHPTQKPVALYEYLIKTYTNEGETVLDICMGSCTTGIACLNTNRKFIGIEKDNSIFSVGSERIKAREAELLDIPFSCDKTDTMKLNSQVSLPLFPDTVDVG